MIDSRPLVVIAAGLALLFASACWGCPSSPSVSTQPITISPQSVPVFTGATQDFTASGGPGPFTWTLPGGGGDIQPLVTGGARATLTAGPTPGNYRVRATATPNVGEATFSVVVTRTNFISVGGLPAVVASGCRVTVVANYITAEDGLRIRAAVNYADGSPAPPYQPMSVAVSAAGQVELQTGTTNGTTESVDIILFRDVDVYHVRVQAHYAWPSCTPPSA